jgi:hypothetical protein
MSVLPRFTSGVGGKAAVVCDRRSRPLLTHSGRRGGERFCAHSSFFVTSAVLSLPDEAEAKATHQMFADQQANHDQRHCRTDRERRLEAVSITSAQIV